MFEASRRNMLKILGVGAAAPAMAVTAKAMPAATPEQIASGFQNPFHIPPEIIPKGWRYEWKRVFIDSDTQDAYHLSEMLAMGWTPVPLKRHDRLFRPGTADSNVNVMARWIEVGGLVLMEKRTA